MGGVIGILVDASDGAIYNLEPTMDLNLRTKIRQGKENTITLLKNIFEKKKGHKIGQLDRLTT